MIGYFLKQRQGAGNEDDVNKAKTFQDSFNDEGGLLADQDDVEVGNIMDNDDDDDDDDEEDSDEDEEEDSDDSDDDDDDEEESEEEESDEDEGM